MDIDHLPTQLENRAQVYCVTGGGGYIGSWLVKTLLENGYTVHATLRDPSKNTFLRSLPGSQERLHLFTADLCEEGSFDSAIHGCHGVFHVATPMVFGECKDPEPCRLTSLYLFSMNRAGLHWTLSGKPVARAGSIRSRKYLQRKLRCNLERKAALLPVVAGPSITSTAPIGVNMVLSLITGNPQLYGSLLQLNHTLANSVALIHVQDACNAHLFLMEQPAANGRYLCSGHTTAIPELAHLISERYPQYTIKAKFDEYVAAARGCTISSRKLSDLGFNYKYSLEEVIDGSVQCFKKLGVLD